MNRKNSKDSLEGRLSEIPIPEPEAFIKKAAGIPDFYGILFAADKMIRYASFNNKKELERIYNIKNVGESIIFAIFSTPEQIYFGGKDAKISSLFGHNPQRNRDGSVCSIIEKDGKVFDAGTYGICETLTDKYLINRIELQKNLTLKAQVKKSGIRRLVSLTSHENKLYALVYYYRFDAAVRGINEIDGKYDLGKEILCYPKRFSYVRQATFLPKSLSMIGGKEYGFSVLSCVQMYHLDLNGEKIKGTEGNYIYRFAILSSNSERAEVVYSGELHGIKFAEIDLNKKSAKTRKLIPGLDARVTALEVVKDWQMHEKLINFGKVLK